jgi:hypothetical protein
VTEQATSAEIVADVVLGIPVWVTIDDKNWLVEGYDVVNRAGRIRLHLGATDGSERIFNMEEGSTVQRREELWP